MNTVDQQATPAFTSVSDSICAAFGRCHKLLRDKMLALEHALESELEEAKRVKFRKENRLLWCIQRTLRGY